MTQPTRLLVLAAALSSACAPTLTADDEDAGPRDARRGDASIPAESGAFVHEVDEDGVITTVVDATSTSDFRFLDLDTGHSVDASEGWDLAFSRFRVRVNGGTTGGGGVQVALLDGADWGAVTEAPDGGWTVPGPDGEDDDDTEPDNVFNNGTDDWYEYEIETHTLTARDRVYVVASTERRFYKLQLLDYYDGAGSPAWVRFRWAEIDAPPSELPDAGPSDFDAGMPMDAGGPMIPPDAITVEAGDGATWVYVSAEDGVVTPADPESDLGWDIALRRTEVRTNSGTSGAGVGGAMELEGSTAEAFDAITDATTFGYRQDAVIDTGRPGSEPTSLSEVLGDWYDYDPMFHSVSAGDRTYLVRTATGGYAKLRVWHWDDGTYQLSFEPVARRVEVRELDVDASDGAAWTYLSLRDGAPVVVADAATDGAWDVGLSRTRARTNGGTSGAGMGAAVETSTTALAMLADAPTEGFVVDEMMSEGPPGSPEFSGNPALGGWYDYDPTTHTVTPREVVYVVRAADGTLGALRVSTWSDGAMRVEIAYAGPERTTFS